LGRSIWPSGFVALAIDPLYAPAILTVGSIEYQLGRVEEAMELFMTLTTLPEDEEDLRIIIDKAGDFLIDQDDYENAFALYSAAEKAYPKETVYLNGSGYCLAKLGRFEDSVEKHRRADALEPNNYKHLNDLGYSLLEAGKFDEAEEVLQRSISLAPPDYEFPRNNLDELKDLREE
jgi:tetratricopeptide (TPR) repeat protein